MALPAASPPCPPRSAWMTMPLPPRPRDCRVPHDPSPTGSVGSPTCRPGQATRGRSEATVGATAVAFDLGGVLIKWDPRRLYRQLFDDAAAMESFLSEVCTPAWNARQDAGRPWPEATQSLAREFPAQRDLILAYDTRWEEMLGGAMADTVEILDELCDAGVPCYALSNWSAAKFALTRPHFPFLERFKAIVISGDVGLSKPDPAIYRVLVERYRLTPSMTAFIDDAEPNVLVAAELGFRAIHFLGAPRLRTDLRNLGLPLAAATSG